MIQTIEKVKVPIILCFVLASGLFALGSTAVAQDLGGGTGEPWRDIIGIRENVIVRLVGIDIKPGSDPNSINCQSRGEVAVAILDELSISPGVDVSTIVLEGAPAVRASREDADGDGEPDDLVVHFLIQDISIAACDTSTTEWTLFGLLEGWETIVEGGVTIVVVGSGPVRIVKGRGIVIPMN